MTRFLGPVLVIAIVVTAGSAFASASDGEMDEGLATAGGDALDPSRSPPSPRREAWVSVASLIEAALRARTPGSSGEGGDEVARIAFRARRILGASATDVDAWVVRSARKEKEGYLLIMANLDTGKVYEIQSSGLTIVAKPVV